MVKSLISPSNLIIGKRLLIVAATLGFTALAEQFQKAEHEAHTDIERKNALITINEFIEQTRQVLLKNGVMI